jgi:hypothetical protein
MILRWQSVISIFTCSCLICMASTTGSSIGVVMTTGSVQVDGLQVPGTSAIFSGSLISSGDRSANLQFADGTSVAMRPGSKLIVYREHSVVQQGIATQRGVDKHQVIVDGLRVTSVTANASAVVGVKDGSHFEVKAQEGESDVWTPDGMLVARIEPGNILSFAIAQASAPEAKPKEMTLCGGLDANFEIANKASNVTYRLRGTDLDSYVNKTVKVTGTTVSVPASPSEPQLLAVSKIKEKKSCEKGILWWSGGIPLLIFIAAGGALIGLGAAGDFEVNQPAVTPVRP